MRWRRSKTTYIRPTLAVLAAALLAGCATYRPRPLDPAKAEADFRARSLRDPGLQAFIGEHRPAGRRGWPPARLDLGALTLVALYYHPDLEAARARLAIAEAGVITAGARPNPSVGVVARYNFNAADLPSPLTFEPTFEVPIETAGKRRIRVVRAERLTDAARLALAVTTWQVRSGVRNALLAHLVARRDRDLLREEEDIRAESVRVFERRLAVGDVSRPDVDAARADLANTRLALRAAETRVTRTRLALASSLGLPAEALDGFGLAWPDLDRPPAPDLVAPDTVRRAAVLNRLDLRQALAEYAAAESALRLEVAKQYPDVRLGPGYVFEEGDNKFQIGFSVVLPILNRNEGPIAEAEARRQEAAVAFLAAQGRVIGDVESALRRYRGALAELADAGTALDLLLAREAAVRRAMDAGEEDRVTLVGVRVQRAVAARARLNALARAQAALGALEDAVQRPLPPEKGTLQ